MTHTSLRRWCAASDGAPKVGDLIRLNELDSDGSPTGRDVLVRVEMAPIEPPRRASSSQRLPMVDVPTEWPKICRCNHVRTLHKEHDNVRGACTLCSCDLYHAFDPREEPL